MPIHSLILLGRGGQKTSCFTFGIGVEQQYLDLSIAGYKVAISSGEKMATKNLGLINKFDSFGLTLKTCPMA